ncbi:hypothetical protein M0R45_003136 [Rubus argutus]|uniref:Uncharacterized protein n=1 Tax=Rubus argutus TaxID=59490 RepID=A0AAW1YH42_RUBAR
MKNTKSRNVRKRRKSNEIGARVGNFLPEGFRRRSETRREAQSPSFEAPVVRERSRAFQSERRREGERRQRDWAWLGVKPEKANWTVKQKEVVGTFGIRFWGSDWK